MPVQGNTYTFEDLSGITTTSNNPNPYNALIEACHHDPVQIQARYAQHRTARAAQQRGKLLASDFPGVTIDPILRGLIDEQARAAEEKTEYKDERHCFVFWARPPDKVKRLIAEVQKRLLQVVPSLWTMPTENLHMTVLEVTHSRTAEEVEALVAALRPMVPAIVDYTYTPSHHARLVKPMVSYDAAAIALSYLPAAGEGSAVQESGRSGNGACHNEDYFTYHHLRHDIWEMASNTSTTNTAAIVGRKAEPRPGVTVESRYVVPSVHLTIGRFVTAKDVSIDGTEDGGVNSEVVANLVKTIDDINKMLEREYWPRNEQNEVNIKEGGEWLVGEEKGLDCRSGTLWYGDGTTVQLGRGF